MNFWPLARVSHAERSRAGALPLPNLSNLAYVSPPAHRLAVITTRMGREAVRLNPSSPTPNRGSRQPPSHTVRVRMGTQTWTVSNGGTASEAVEPVLRIERRNPPITLAAMRARIEEARAPTPSRSRLNRVLAAARAWVLPPGEGRFQAGLKTGLASGMMLGSLALVGFHQLATPVARAPAMQTEARAWSTRGMAGPSTSVAYPGLSIEVAVPTRASGGSPWLALTAVGIRHVLQATHSQPGDYEMHALRLQAGAVALPGALPPGVVSQDENALALAESALLAAVAWAADGGRRADAERALANALAIPKETWIRWPNGEGRVGWDLYQALKAMRTSVSAGDVRRCESQAVRALNDWLHLCGWPGVVELSKMAH